MGVDHTARNGAETAERRSTRSPLAPALRSLASRCAEHADGVVLILVLQDASKTPHLRAAAGFPTAQLARETAAALCAPIAEALAAAAPCQAPCPAPLAERVPQALEIQPLRLGERTLGALVVGSRAPLTAAQQERIAHVAELAALRLDHARLARELESAEARLRENDPEDRNEELLKLSEALFAQDIELLRKDEKLGKIEKLKNDFIEKMSRELRTPLNKIIEAVISVLTGENETLSEDAKTALRYALDDGSTFQRTLQNILDLWKIKQGELPVEIQDVNFRELVNEAIFSIQDKIDPRKLAVEPRLQDPFPKFRSDVTKLNQILFLLLENAVRFTPEGQVEILAHVRDDRLVCEVRDTGVGICPDDQQFVFDEFFQVDDSASSRYGGAGLGLALVRDLVVLLDGEIGISSDVGRGTSMTFQVPVQLSG